MTRSTLIQLIVIATLVGGVVTVADALVVTEEERLDRFVDTLDSGRPEHRIAESLRWVDADRESVSIRIDGVDDHYGEGQDAELAATMRDALAPFASSRAEIVQRSISIEADEARIALRVRTLEGMTDAVFDLRRHDDRWLVSRIQTRSSAI